MEPEDREFMRELTMRHERSSGAMLQRLEEMRLEIAAGRQVLLDLHEAVRAQNQALFKVLDRLA